MPTEMISRWPVCISLSVETGDREEDGRLTGGEVTTAMRDEFIAHAHAATYTH
jgi:hypothetical protein